MPLLRWARRSAEVIVREAGLRRDAARSHISQRLPVMHTAVYNFVSQCLVHALGYFIVDPCIRRYLNAALAAGPVFGDRQKFPAYPAVPVAFSNVPTLDLPVWAHRVAAVCVGAQVNFQKPN
jgi:hypothetical protein